ncbi:Sfi1 spindle body protein-domain-containing protein [Cubamyces menziesii]|nr:Sfi1 spindle body protein-domain-containing protein [Cubamyces menziesii]
MEGPLKELAKLEKLAAGTPSAKGKAPSVDQSLDALLDSLRNAKESFQEGTGSQAMLETLAKTVEEKKKEVDDRQKEVYNALAKFGKALDKKFPNPLPSYDPLFTSAEAKASLERTVAIHFLRTGQFETAEMFLSESSVNVPSDMRAHFMELHQIMLALKNGDIIPALRWAYYNDEFLELRSSPLQFHLHRFEYLRQLLLPEPDIPAAIQYARTHFPPFFAHHSTEIGRLMNCPTYLPLSRFTKSPYADLASPSIHTDLERMFATEYCANLGMSRQAPLRVISDIGGGGALARIEKGRKVMRERKSEWSQADELPIEIPLPHENRYHSVFACPVSKEQSTEANPPMMMTCGHVITKESLQKLSKPGGWPSTVVSEYTDDSRASGVCAPELTGLTPEEIDFIDEVINRAPATASTFLTVFKAYNDVLQERGLDPQNEVVYYGKLLKIGTLKGKSWADKWKMVKDQQGYAPTGGAKGGRRTHVSRTTPTPAKSVPVPTSRHARRDDTFTLSSQQDDITRTDDGTEVQPKPFRHRTDTYSHSDTPRPRRPFMSPATATTNNSLGLDTGPPSSTLDSRVHLHQDIARRAVGARTNNRWDAETTAATETTQASSTIPPSYGAAVRDTGLSAKEKVSALVQRAKDLRSPAAPSPVVSTAPRPTAQPPSQRERRGSVIDADEAWENIRMAQDEQTADEYYRSRLIERCWEVWKQGYQWIITTGEQISEARDSLILRRALQHWRRRTAARQELYTRVAALSNRRYLKRAMHIWKLKFKEKKQARWKEEMRARMKTLRERDELVLKKDMWTKWRHAYHLHTLQTQFEQRVVIRFFDRWKSRMRRLDELEAAAEHFTYAKDEKAVEQSWDTWRHATQLRLAERALRDRVDLRIMANAIDTWRKHFEDYRVADEFHDTLVVKQALRKWKAARQRIRTLENRAAKHVARQDEVLVRAVMRVWKAHERGKLLTRVRNIRLMRQAWTIMKQRMDEQKEREELAQLFATRSSSVLASASFQKWRNAYNSHQNAHTFAVHYHKAQLQYKMLLNWRLQLRAKLRMVKQAKAAQKHLLLRRYLHVWKVKAAEKQRERKLKEFQRRTVAQYFREWLERTKHQRELRLAEQVIQQRAATRIMTEALTHWTSRVADIKFQELEMAQKYDRALVLRSYKKWKALCKRHVDELSLMESYQDVKREENMRKMFYRWLAAARKARHRRLYLQEREDEFKLTVVAAAWDKWRERFLDIRLQPMADAFIKQRQKGLMFRAFAVWHSKSRAQSLPAVRFHASNLKLKYWRKWRDAMPRALQAKTAREMDRRITLSKAFEHWKKAHKNKVELKAIARARYLNLTPAVPRQTQQSIRPPTLSAPLRPRTTPRVPRQPSPTEDESDAPPPAAKSLFPRPTPARRGLASLLESRPRAGSLERSRRSPERPKLSSRSRYTASRAASPEPADPEPEPEREPARAPSSVYGGIARWQRDVVRPLKSAPSSVAGDPPRSSLWSELKEVRRKARAPTERAYSPEPL